MREPTTTVRLPFGRGQVSIVVPRASLIGVYEPQETAEPAGEAALVERALAGPVGTPRLAEVARAGDRVAIVTSDLTRPCPSHRLLPPLLEELRQAGVRERDVTIVMALGLHRPMTASELEAAVGWAVCRRVRVINHDPRDTVRLGVTARGTPVEVFRPVAEADRRICLGNLEFHYFAGYSGGAKAIIPGCASQATVTANHAMMVHPDAVAGRLEGNPVRADLEEAAAMAGVDFILNVRVDGQERIVAAVAGDVTAAHRWGCEGVAARGRVAIPERADVVVAGAGGYPRDLNLYQAQKALDNASLAAREGGAIILVAECAEGLGNPTFEAWMTGGQTPQEILERIRERFVLGGHKAAAIARVARRQRVLLVSPGLAGASLMGMEHFPSAQAALDAALAAVGAGARVIVLPQAASLLPQAADGAERGAA